MLNRQSLRSPIRTGLVVFLALVCGLVSIDKVAAWSLPNLFGPSIEEVSLGTTLYRPTPRDIAKYRKYQKEYTWRNPETGITLYVPPPPPKLLLRFSLVNSSDYYIERVVVDCEHFDSAGNRLAKVEVYLPMQRDELFVTGETGAAIAPGNRTDRKNRGQTTFFGAPLCPLHKNVVGE
jgi:hypothetical protein